MKLVRITTLLLRPKFLKVEKIKLATVQTVNLKLLSFSHKVSRLLLALLCILSTGSFAATYSFKVLDQHGAPIQNAVLSSPSLQTQPPALEPAIMDQVDKQFLPRVLVIAKDQFVKFPNSDNIRHHVYSFSAPKPFEIRLFDSSNAAPLQFERPGIVTLGCNIHDQMLAYIYVAENESTAISDKDGFLELETSSDTLHIWHAQLSASNSERQMITRAELPQGETQIIQLSLLPGPKNIETGKFGSNKFGSKGD